MITIILPLTVFIINAIAITDDIVSFYYFSSLTITSICLEVTIMMSYVDIPPLVEGYNSEVLAILSCFFEPFIPPNNIIHYWERIIFMFANTF